MPTYRWVDKTQPQTLMMATVLLYVNAALLVILSGFGALFSGLGFASVAGMVAAGLGIANEKKWGYWLGVGVLVLVIANLVVNLNPGAAAINILFYGAMLALLLHRDSRAYRKTWFK